MGIYFNPGNEEFYRAVNSQIYVDKTELIRYTNQYINTEHRNICVSRPRRFGKSMAANMLTAYYSSGCDSKDIFKEYKIAECDNFEKHLNKYNKSLDIAIEQIKNKEYVQCLKGYTGNIILVGISYENNDSGKDGYKKHRCKIEKIVVVG